MDNEKKEKPKKKKVIKKDAEESEFGEKIEEKNMENIRQREQNQEKSDKNNHRNAKISISENSEDAVELLTINQGKSQDTSREKGRSPSEVFYVAHHKSIKRAINFKDVYSRKLSELLEAFNMLDFDRDGVINDEDLRKTFASLCLEVKEEEINQMLSEGLNPLNFDAFVILLGYKTLDLDPEEVLLDALSNWDDHHEGFISYERLMHYIMAWGDKFTKEEAIAAIADAPIVLNKTKEKMIDYIQFSEDLCGLRKMMQRKTSESEN